VYGSVIGPSSLNHHRAPPAALAYGGHTEEEVDDSKQVVGRHDQEELDTLVFVGEERHLEECVTDAAMDHIFVL
jgi:3-deoxy-D-arabino-heptulosonate 7-phosphate (DAHP) synthase class II